MKIVKIVVKRDGSIELDFHGFKGLSCFELRDKILEILREKGLFIKKEVEVRKPEAEEVSEEAWISV